MRSSSLFRALAAVALLLGLSFGAAGCRDEAKPLTATQRSEQAEGLYLQANSLFLQGQFAEAQAAFDQMRALSPDDPRLPAAIGELLLAQGKLRDALPHFEQAIAKDPKRGTNWSRVGFIKAQLGETEQARSALRQAVALHAADFNALEALAELDLKDGKVDDAVANLERAADASPSNTLASIHYLHAARSLTDASRPDEALALLERAVKKGKADATVHAELGEHLIRTQRFADAAKALTDAANATTPPDPGLWELVGELYGAMEKPADAMAAFQQSLAVKDRALVHLAIARMQKRTGDVAAARASLERALASATGEEAREPLELARALVEFDRAEDALRLYGVLSREPDHEKNVALQVETARVAKEAGRRELSDEACARARAAEPKLTQCP